jgi:hypothetical protein
MTQHDIRDHLQALPPELPEKPERFELVRARVRRRRRIRAACAAVGVVAAAVAVPAALHGSSGSFSDGERRVDPAATQSPSATAAARQPPGADEVVELSGTRTHDGTGTETVRLGARPSGATAVRTSLTCLSPGLVRWPHGASMSCERADVPTTAEYAVDLPGNGDDLVVRARAGMSWQIETTYVRVEPTDWGVNANGDTYGVSNDRGEPDLLAVIATNGRAAYVYADDLAGGPNADPTSPAEALEQQEARGDRTVTIPAYESDGETVAGEFAVSGGEGS